MSDVHGSRGMKAQLDAVARAEAPVVRLLQGEPGIAWRCQMNEEWVIYNKNEKLFWSNEDGWVDFDSATRFNETEQVTVSLPVIGEKANMVLWIRIKEGGGG